MVLNGKNLCKTWNQGNCLYQDGAEFQANSPVYGTQADRKHNIDYKAEPVVANVPAHVHKRATGQCKALPEKSCLAST